MYIKMIDLVNSIPVLDKISNMKFDDGITSYKIARNIKIINSELTIFNEARDALIGQHGTKDDSGKVKIHPSQRDEFTRKLNELFSQKVNIDILTINPEKLSGYTPMEIQAVEWMLELEKEG